ncbi:site-specific integrase [Spirosoma sp. KCTC 42546]|uniref:site-specific integrase n=1 Tax=Spirosoma sp. KCTC 42546 TaxID=2520506 RepID=UPI00115BA6E7|nr:site-specific integrase [Spirosoma sp. KCTC 42546]QDK77160.1 site-specific integrase [Spirosoma sp. KCTC 42546]
MPRTTDLHPTFVLRDPNATTVTPIISLIRFHNTRIKLPTGYKVLPEHWNCDKQRVKPILAAKNREKINAELLKIEKAVQSASEEIGSETDYISKESLKAKIISHLNPITKDPINSEPKIFKFIKNFIKNSPERINPNTGKKIERRTIQKYNTVLHVLTEFSVSYSRKLDFETIDLEFYFDFNKYLTAKSFSKNNIGKYIQTLKTFLNEATISGHNNKLDYKSRNFKVTQEDSDSIYLTESELTLLYAFNLSNNERLERIRDLFLVGAYTGLRFSDLTNLRPEHIKNGKIKLEQLKTMDKVVIPCHPIVNLILEKYNGKLPRSISNQKMNDYIKEVCELAGLNEVVSKGITKGGARIIKNFRKFELVSTHTARRSFATNMYKLNIPTITIMKVTGHKSEKSFLRYIKLSEEEHAEIMQNFWNQSVLVNFPINDILGK